MSHPSTEPEGPLVLGPLLEKDATERLYALGFRIDSLTGLGLTYVYFQVPLMVILVTPALEGLLPQWREAAGAWGFSTGLVYPPGASAGRRVRTRPHAAGRSAAASSSRSIGFTNRQFTTSHATPRSRR